MAPPRNVLFITVDQWRGDCLSALGHPVVETPALDALARRGVLFANHWANAAPCGPSRACLYTGHLPAPQPLGAQRHPARRPLHQRGAPGPGVGLRPRPVRLHRYLGRPADGPAGGPPPVHATRGSCPGSAPSSTTPGNRGARRGEHGWPPRASTSPPTPMSSTSRFRISPAPTTTVPRGRRPGSPPHLSQTRFVGQAVTEWLEANGDEPFFVHASFIRPHPPRRNPVGYHDLYHADQIGDFVGCARPRGRGGDPPPGGVRHVRAADSGRRSTIGTAARLRATYYGAQREVDDGLGQLFDFLEESGLAESTLIIVTSDHGEMGGDHWLLEKLGYWDESYHVPLIVVDPRPEADGRPRHRRRRGHRVGRHSPDHLRVHRCGGSAPGRRVVAGPVQPGRGCSRALAGHGPLRMGLLRPVGPDDRELPQRPHEPLLAGGVAGPVAQVRAVRHGTGRVPAPVVRPAGGSAADPQPVCRTG